MVAQDEIAMKLSYERLRVRGCAHGFEAGAVYGAMRLATIGVTTGLPAPTNSVILLGEPFSFATQTLPEPSTAMLFGPMKLPV